MPAVQGTHNMFLNFNWFCTVNIILNLKNLDPFNITTLKRLSSLIFMLSKKEKTYKLPQSNIIGQENYVQYLKD
jgi:hypothetical protein